ncbi:MAG TPA: CHAD domain-containing protein [Solirubrobacteraceae bacterium]|nr:CHAD domain-containing protein [Solirubrobacteraceae bacterium]
MAPLLAGVTASVALGLGVSIARLARERRAKRSRQLGLRPGEPLGGALQRMALEQLDLTLEVLSDGEGPPSEKAVHETRKALKRLRALLRMLEPELDPSAYAREDAALKDAGRRLAGARDAEVMLATLDGLVERNRGKLSGRGGVIRLRAALLAEREAARRDTLGDPAARTHVLAELRACRVRVAAWRLPERSQLQLIEAGLVRLYRKGEKRRRRAAAARRGDMHKLHEWRKRVKDLRYVAEMLRPLDEQRQRSAPKGKRARKRVARARKDAAWLARMARRADKLGELLGEDHDLAVLAQLIETDAPMARPGKKTRRTLLKLIAKQRAELRKRALEDGALLYAASPKQLMRRVRGAQRLS